MENTSHKEKITVIGGGNIGTQFACQCAAKGHEVTVFSSRPEAYDGTLEIVDEFGRVTTGRLRKVTDSLQEAASDSRILFVTYPAFRLRKLAEELLPYVTKDMTIVVLPGTGGAEFAFGDCVRAGATLCGLQRVPGVARLERYGKRVRCEGLRSQLYLAAIPHARAQDLAAFMANLWDIPCAVLPNYLSVTLTPSNPILHTARLRTLFRDYHQGVRYPENPLFYGQWDDASSELLLACDGELQGLCRRLDRLDLSNVRSLRFHYESETVQEMTRKLCSIRSLHDLASPMKQVDGGWVPDFGSRYFTADFPYGLAIIEELGTMLSAKIPNICQTMDWYREVTGNTEHFKFSDYGIRNVSDLYRVYGVQA